MEESEKTNKKDSVRKVIGPGLITGAADDDPSGIATYSQAGAQTGFGLLWMAVFTFPLMVIVQEMSARIALVTGRGLAENIKRHFSEKILFVIAFFLVTANTINIAADLSIMATVVNHMLPRIHLWTALISITLLSLLLEVFVSYKKYASYLKWLTLILVSYVITGLLVNLDAKELLLSAFIPSFNFTKESILIVTAILGTTISPYLFFWQASEEIEDEIAEGNNTLSERVAVGAKNIKNMRTSTWIGMFFSNLIMFFIIAVCAEILFKNGITNIENATDAALALKPLAGDFAYLLFFLGILGTGLLAVPVIAGSSAYVISETFGWKEGLYRKWSEAKLFYGVIIFSFIVGLVISLLGIDPIKSLIYSAVINGLIAPFIILTILLIAKNEAIMGENMNSPARNRLGWALFTLMFTVATLMIWSLF